MKKLIVALVAVVAFGLLGLNASPANAGDFGIHISGPGYHVDFGDAHHGRYYGGYRGHYPVEYRRAEPVCHDDRAWHDTSHYDYHPAELIRHRGHYHYEPGHYDFHKSGHWDHRGW